MSPRYWIDDHFRFRVRLANGTTARLRLLRPEDRAKLISGLAHLSAESRYRRFLGATTILSDSALRYLTHPDNVNHVAVVATTDASPNAQEGLGIARFIRLRAEPEVAEPAITVADEAQGLGLGRILLAALTIAAWERGVRRFRAELLESNRPVLALLQELDPNHSAHCVGGELLAEAMLPEVPSRSAATHDCPALTNELLRVASGNLGPLQGGRS